MEYAPEFLQNAALIIVSCFAQRLISGQTHGLIRAVLSGLLFGGASILAMSTAIVVEAGLIFDARTVVLSIGALFGGPIVAAISSLAAAAFRLYVGGAGVWIGICVIATATGAGLLLRRHHGPDLLTLGVPQFLGLGLTVHVVGLLWFAFVPLDYVGVVLGRLAAPYLVSLTLATVAMGMLLREIESLRLFDRVLDESNRRLQNLFDSTATALLEEDISGVYAALRALRDSGVSDLRSHLAQHPALIDELAGKVRVLQTNPAAVRLFRAASEDELTARIDSFFGPGARQTFVDQLCAIWDGAESFQQETIFLAGDGSPLVCIINVPIQPDEDRARHVPVSILDITAQRRSEGDVLMERERLKEVVWGTGVGTWEWNVKTGDTVFNERWAEIVGYTLAELAPVTIATWERLTHPDDLQVSEALLTEVFERKRNFYECEARMCHKDGRWIWVLDRGSVVQWAPDGSPLRMSGTHMDITVRKQAEERAEHLASIRATLLQCHADILAARSETDMFERTVATLVDARGYSLAWIGIADDGPDGVVRPVAYAGPLASHVDGLIVHRSDDRFGQGPTGRAFRTGKIQIARDLAIEAGYEPWIESAQRHSLTTSVAVPILADGEVLAALSIYSSNPDVFPPEELALIEEFAQNIGLAVRTRRLQAEQLRLHHELEQAALGAVSAVAATIEKRDPYTAGHQESVAALSIAIGRKLGWSDFKIRGLELGAAIHDIGKISIPSEILNRPGALSKPEFEIIKAHPQIGYEILEKTSFPWPIQDMVVQHHERADGSGYPKGLHAGQIIDEAKVISVADVVDAITAHRPYRPSLGIDAALSEIERGKGTLYDPAVVDACLAVFREDGYSLGHR